MKERRAAALPARRSPRYRTHSRAKERPSRASTPRRSSDSRFARCGRARPGPRSCPATSSLDRWLHDIGKVARCRRRSSTKPGFAPRTRNGRSCARTQRWANGSCGRSSRCRADPSHRPPPPRAMGRHGLTRTGSSGAAAIPLGARIVRRVRRLPRDDRRPVPYRSAPSTRARLAESSGMGVGTQFRRQLRRRTAARASTAATESAEVVALAGRRARSRTDTPYDLGLVPVVADADVDLERRGRGG